MSETIRDTERTKWIAKFGRDRGFNDWFTNEFQGAENLRKHAADPKYKAAHWSVRTSPINHRLGH